MIESASLAVAMIGQGLALARGRLTKHAIKQVDRLLSNPGIDVDALLRRWVPYVVGDRSSITVAMVWTDFDADGQTTIMLSLLCRHGGRRPRFLTHPRKSTLASAPSPASWPASGPWPSTSSASTTSRTSARRSIPMPSTSTSYLLLEPSN